MSFLNPAFLWALPIVMVPALLHLLNRRPPKKMVFSHIAWLKEVHQRALPRKRIKDLILLIVRTLLLLFLVGLFARPILHRGQFLKGADEDETMVVLMDVSASMGAITGGRSALDLAKEQAPLVLRKMPAGTRIGLISYSDRVEKGLAPTTERSRISTAISAVKVTARPTDILPALKQAAEMLASQARGRKSILIISDQARGGWQAALNEAGRWEGFDPEVRVILWEIIPKLANAGIGETSVSLSEEGILKGKWTAYLSGSGIKPAWKLSLNSRTVGQGPWPEGTDSRRDMAFQAQLPEGGFYAGQLELTADALPFDDIYYLAGRVPKGFRLLMVDGEGGFAPSDSEVYYLRSALESPRDPRLESVRVIRPESLPEQNFYSYDAIVLANITDVGGRESDLINWVEKGGGLLVSAGSKWSAKAGNVPLQLFRAAPRKKGAESVKPPDPATPLLSGVAGLDTFQWDQIRVNEHIALEPDAAATVILELGNTDPLLVRKQFGKGFVLCLTTTLDRSWTNLPAKPVFAPLFRELIAALADPLREQSSLNLWLDEPVRLSVPVDVRSAAVIGPDGTASGATINRQNILEWPAPTLPGLYRVETNDASSNFAFAVNIRDRMREGDTARITESEAREVFPNASVEWLSPKGRSVENLLDALQGWDATTAVIALLFLLLFIETAVAFLSARKMEARA